MKELTYSRERTLATVTLILGIIAWLILIIGTFGTALFALAIGYIVYLFAQSALIAHIKGTAVELSAEQYPDLYAQFSDCCERLQMNGRPQAYILNGNGGLNAFATKFLGKQYVFLMSDIVDAMNVHTDGVRFYIGHELGHLKRKHLGIGHLIRWPVLWLPLVGAAYSRTRESTCDRHGLACSSSGEGAAQALAALASGSVRWKSLDVQAYVNQSLESSGFWMSFHELIGGYPWLVKRAARVLNPDSKLPRRNGAAYLLALFVPYAGRLGAGLGLLTMVYIVGVLAAVAVPEYQTYVIKAKLTLAVTESEPARQALASYYETNHKIPGSLEQVAINPQIVDGGHLSVDASTMILTVSTKQGELLFIPKTDQQEHVYWTCSNGRELLPVHLPENCRKMGN
ncbi:M48 family metalloprotease [Undibacterium sp. SXout20W]|uniref:M48 family metalloprotease n=1 Tax=Undibacterium sp. SXout20W TaxID=3413051 RepID=UPI003BF1987B